MVRTIYIFILCYFLLGGLGFHFINRKKDKAVAQKSWTKFFTYFVIINVLFFSIVIDPRVFRIVSAIILAVGALELIMLYAKRSLIATPIFIGSIIVFTVLAFGFWKFSGAEKEVLLYTFIILSIFDAFSQISGQLWGKRKIAPQISPNKTVGGTVGGALFALLSTFFLKQLLSYTIWETIFLTSGIIVFAFAGDLAASFYKRKFNTKDYSQLIPGHGGFLDRFDSLIAGGAWVALYLAF
ncbi:phosphatidate cytidylyltransferase [Maribellus sediminis]|uniref:phosphatidate cytidylyltransferase n=1 Tax=Maribellus sediminis TaxID=2696285 RepID=UPI001430BFE1|nr:phosphatidate cytidylyltransferase [Maribellus sediminis]